MLSVIRDEFGRISASLEWNLVNERGQLDRQGRYIFVHQIEVSPGCENRDLMKQFIPMIADLAPRALGAYWVRLDRGGNVPHRLFSRTQLLSFARKPTITEEVRV